MSTNSNLQQINVFSKGMNTDTSDAYISNELYRYAENLRFITDTGENSGELRLIEGYVPVFQELFENPHEVRNIVAATSIRNLLIFLTTVNAGRGRNTSEILVLNTDNGSYTTPYESKDLWNSENEIGEPIKYSLVTRWESDKNIKLYIADGENEIMSLNLVKPNGYYTSKLMLYGTNSDYLMPIECEISEQTGNIRCPVILYCYYLYTEGSSRSDLSPLSKKITFSKLEEDQSSGKAVDISIDVRIGNFNKIRIFRIEYVRNSSVPNVYMITDEDLTTSVFKYTDKGLQTHSVSFAEYKGLLKLHIKPKIIESKENYLFAANIEDVSEQQNNKFKDVSVTYTLIADDPNFKYKIDRFGQFVDGQENYGPSLMAGETYRYGFVYYTSDGQRSSVLNITDVEVPEDIKYINEIEKVDEYYTEFNRIGVKFTISNLPDDCIGYEVVRCERTVEDSNTITQGIIGCTFGRDAGNLRYASSFMSMLDMKCRDSGKPYSEYYGEWLSDTASQSDLIMFSSPESSYLMDDVDSVLKTYKTGLSIQELYRYHINYESNGLSTFNARLPLRSVEDTLVYDPTASAPTNGNMINHRNQRKIVFFYINPTGNVLDFTKLSGEVSEYNHIYSPTSFDDGNTIQISKDIAIVDNFEFYNWDAWMYFKNGLIDITYLPYNNQNDPNNTAYYVSSGKKCILLKSDIQKISASNVGTNDSMFLSVANIRRLNVNPYGGFTDEAKKENTFYSYGNYFARTEGLSNAVDIYDGDVYNCIYIYNSSHAWDSAKYATLEGVVIYSVPLLTRVDLTLRTGDLWPDLKDSEYSYFLQDLKGKYGGLIQDKDAYVYNTVYSLSHTANSYYAEDVKDIDSGKYDTRVFYSDPKTNGELVDSWSNYKALNFLDVDSRYGQITGLRLFKNSLVYWQKNATGILSVNERTILQDANDTNIILGNGDVLQRFDYITTKYGMADNLFCDTLSDNILYWWDEDNSDLIMYPGGLNVLPMKIAKTVSNFINKSVVENPTLAYDNKYKEIIFSNIQQKSLVYNEIVQQFTSIYDITFKHKAEVGNKLLLMNDSVINKWNEKCNLIPTLVYIVNDKNTHVKVYDNTEVGMGESFFYDNNKPTTSEVDKLKFKFHTVGQDSQCEKNITSREYDLRFAIPRNSETTKKYNWCERMRGKTMRCELTLSDNSTYFSILYIITKYRISWS